MFFNPKPDPKHPDNNMTYLDQVTQLKTGSLKIEMDSDLKDGEAVKCKVLLLLLLLPLIVILGCRVPNFIQVTC